MSRAATFDEIPAVKLKGIYGLPLWFAPAFGWLVVSVFALIALGGSVRIMNAGLACPDWPLCFGDVIPDYHPQVYFEFIHRVVAGLVAIATVGLQFLLVRSDAPKSLKWLAAGSVLLLLTQIVFGGLTVLLQLHSKVVAAHLGMGTGFFALLMWMYLSLSQTKLYRFSTQSDDVGIRYSPALGSHAPTKREAIELNAISVPVWLKRWSIFLGAAIYGQIILGGLVASHFASLVCTDFPKCQGQWFPTFKGIVGLHLIHRLGAYTIFALVLLNLFLLHKKIISPQLKRIASGTLAMVCVQIGIGIANVLFYTPPLIAVAHLAMATALLSMTVRQVHYVSN